jgi:lipopolysaccharide heptosyltransferase III
LFDGPEGTISMVATMAAPASRHLLVIHPGALGDVLQAVPALRALAALDGGVRVSLAAQPRLAELLAGAGAVGEAVSFDSLGLEGLFADAPVPAALADRLGRYDAVVSWFGARAAPYPERLRALAPRAIVAPPVPDASGAAPVWRHLLSTLAPLGVKPDGHNRAALVAPLAVSLEWRERARAAITTLRMAGNRPVLLVHPGAGGDWKRWPPALFAEAIAQAAAATGCAVLLHEGPADAEATAALAARLDALGMAGDHSRLVEPDLPLLAGALAEARAYLGGDSGISHLAAAVGALAVILFPDATREAWSPWSPRALTLSAGDAADAVSRTAAALVARLSAARP